DIGLEVGDAAAQGGGAGGGDAHLGSAGQRQRRAAVQPAAPSAGGAKEPGGTAPAGGDDRQIIAPGGVVVDDAEHRIGDFVRMGQGGLGDEEDPHAPMVTAPVDPRVTSSWPAVEAPVNYCPRRPEELSSLHGAHSADDTLLLHVPLDART